MKRFLQLLIIGLLSPLLNYAQCFKTLDAGIYFTVAIKADGTLWAWGINSGGQLGDGTQVDRNKPTQIGNATDWVTFSTGESHTLAIKTDGTLWGWGSNGIKQLGIIGLYIIAPTQIGSDTDWKTVSAGALHTVAIKDNGTLWAWGYNGNGQLGNSTNTNIAVPSQVGTATDWTAIAAGYNHTVALRSSGNSLLNTLWAWGYSLGGPGDGTTVSKNYPIQIGTDTDWQKIYANLSSMAIKTNGTLWGWGNNDSGQLGNGSNENVLSPNQIGTETDWRSVSMGYVHTLAVNTHDKLYAWGRNANGQLGDNTTVNRKEPVFISQNTTEIAAGSHNSATSSVEAGGFYSWGDNQYGQIGNGTAFLANVVLPAFVECPTSTLPVELVYFNARKEGGTAALLTWRTAQELNALHYEVQRSTDAIHYSFLGKVRANGNSSKELTYSFTDNSPLAGTNYYRLRQVDNNGNYIETEAKAVQFGDLQNTAVQYYPNPTNGILNIQIADNLAKEAKTITIFNTVGVIVGQHRVKTNLSKNIAVDMSGLAKGVYFVQLKSSTLNSTNRIVLQ